MRTNNLQPVRPVDQMAVLYRPEADSSTLATKAHNLFQKRMRFDLFNRQTLDRLIEVQLRALNESPSDPRLHYEHAFTLLQNEAGGTEVRQAKRTLEAAAGLADADPSSMDDLQTSGRRTAMARLYQLALRLEAQCLGAGKQSVPHRVNWAVNNRCPMVCRGCYNVFSPNQLAFADIRSGIDKLARWGVKELIVSGGDPIIWPDLPDLIDYVHACGIAVGIDTTGYTLTDELARRLSEKVSYLGLPLDGSTNSLQNSFRRGPRDLVDRLQQNLTRCDALGIPVKINTTVTAYNIDDLADIGEIICNYRCVKSWSLFQWWALRTTPEIAEEMNVPDHIFADRVGKVARMFPQFHLRSRNVAEREFTHFFIRNSGQIATFGAGLHEEFLLGHILEHDRAYITSRAALNAESSKHQPVARFNQ